MHFSIFFVVILSIFHSVQATEILTPERVHKRSFSYTASQNNDTLKEVKAVSRIEQNRSFLELDEEDYDNAFLSSEFSQKAAQAFREKDYVQASEYYIKAAWAGDDDSLHYLNDLLSASSFKGKNVVEAYNDEDKDAFSKYFGVLKNILQEK